MRLTTITALLALLAACETTAPDTPVSAGNQALPGPSERVDGEGLAAIELCDAQTYRPLVGTDVGATRFPVSSSLRVFGSNDIVTQDYVPQRTNVVYDDSRRIVRVYCG